MTKFDGHLNDQMKVYLDGLRKKGKRFDQILFALVMRFHPTRAELTQLLYGPYKLYLNRKRCNENIRLFNIDNSYDQQLTGVRATYMDVYGKKRVTCVLTIIDNQNFEVANQIHVKHRDGYNKKIKRIVHIGRDQTVKKRASKLLREIEA